MDRIQLSQMGVNYLCRKKNKKYLIFTLLFQIIILFVGIVPTSSISIGDKLEIVILTNIGLLSGTIAVIYSINKEH